ncbi:alpha/beta fold hydrolase [Chitinimonas sp. BJB300]|uniref:alpha/beta fold hydrolase n=1 Tax=Chitinimonas sp. BJB300 TaxID=1559339 RepID=UPI000C0D04A3|nr:alpha/beta hydrolase [Chitinimonas sp. BJB300]PHV13333.1 alpha/beta hydrolase [Chitinimonas sp. BJB300]TSJ85249.1 alpha/beta hydrolase [Chitinimonas sp. BJB300]
MSTSYVPTLPARHEMVTIRGIDTHICRWGRPGGRPVLLLHGWMDCAATFQFMIDAAPAGLLDFELIALDWRGFGESAWAVESYYFPDYLADLDALADWLAPQQPVILVGHSMGGIVASLYAGIRPERVSHLVSLEGFGLPATRPEQAPERYRRWLNEVGSEAVSTSFVDFASVAARSIKFNAKLTPDKAAWFATMLAESVEGGVRYRADPRHKWVNPVLYRLDEAQACWRQVKARTLWLAGNETKLLAWLGESKHGLQARQRCFTDFSYIELADCGHNLHHDAPAEVARQLTDFLLAG